MISTIARGVIKGDLDQQMLGIGWSSAPFWWPSTSHCQGQQRLLSACPVGAALAIVPADRLVTTPVVLGSMIGWVYDKIVARRPWGESAKQLGVLLASGFIVGESLILVLIAGVTYATGQKKSPSRSWVMDLTGGHAELIGAISFAVVIVVLYTWIQGLAKKAATKPA